VEEQEQQGNPQLDAEMGGEFQPGDGVGVEHENDRRQQCPAHTGAKIAQESVHEEASQHEPQGSHVPESPLNREGEGREFGHQLA